MRPHTLAVVVFAACTHTSIGPDDAGKNDAALLDGAIPDGGPSPDGAAPDGTSPDGGNANADQGYTAGSRLKVRYYVGSDGSEQAIGFFDTTRNENCNYVLATDGVERCLPTTYNYLASYYADSANTQPVFGVLKGCPTPTDGIEQSTASTCGTSARYVALSVGAAFTGSTVYVGTTGYPASNLTPSYDIYTTTGTIAPTSFQDATEVVK